jgi:hypothetical protein
MSCVVCYDPIKKRCPERSTRCPTCVAMWCSGCHELLTESFIRQTIEHIEDLDINSPIGVQCPCCRCVIDKAHRTSSFKRTNFVYYIDGIYRFVEELKLIDRTHEWLYSNSTWISTMDILRRTKQKIQEYESIIDDAVMSINQHKERHRCGCSTDDASCICQECKSNQSELSELRDEHRALVYIKDRLLDDYQSTLSGIPHLFEPYSIVTTKPISDALHELSPSRDTSLMDRVERLDRYGSPITFFTFLRLRIELILEFKCKAAVLLSIVHFCRRRNITIDLLADLQRSCRKSSKTGIRRWLTRVEIRRCIVARKLQKDFMQSLRISIA